MNRLAGFGSIILALLQEEQARRSGCGLESVLARNCCGRDGIHKKKGILRFHKRPKSREETPKEGSDSEGGFTRAFRKSFGVSPYRSLLERRIDYAKALLLTGDLPIANVAMQSGFSDQAAFTRAFGRIVGDSPGRWKRAATSRA
jgi:AraC-like DNA-binding protein